MPEKNNLNAWDKQSTSNLFNFESVAEIWRKFLRLITCPLLDHPRPPQSAGNYVTCSLGRPRKKYRPLSFGTSAVRNSLTYAVCGTHSASPTRGGDYTLLFRAFCKTGVFFLARKPPELIKLELASM
jgi:hypothetical protein